jgi:hypothetical protein
MTLRPFLSALLATGLACAASAQRIAPPAAAPEAPRAFLAAELAPPLTPQGVSRAETPASHARTALFTFAGTAMGAWVGFVASQVVRSDWDKRSDDQFTRYRMRFALGGAVVGGTLAAVFQHRGHRPASAAPQPRSQARPQWAGSRGDAITRDEIARSSARDAYDLVSALRPTWLRLRGDATFHDAPNGTVSGGPGAVTANILPGDGGPKVYLNNGLLGTTSTMHEIPLVSLTEVRFLTPAEASYRFGHGYPDGVILLSTEVQ